MSVLELVGAPSAMGRGASGCCVCAELTGNCNCTGCAGDAATACSGAAAVDVAVGGGVSVAQVPHRSPPHSEQQYALAGRCLMRHCVHDHAHRCRALMRGCPQLGQYGPGLRASPIRTPQSRSCERSVWGVSGCCPVCCWQAVAGPLPVGLCARSMSRCVYKAICSPKCLAGSASSGRNCAARVRRCCQASPRCL